MPSTQQPPPDDRHAPEPSSNGLPETERSAAGPQPDRATPTGTGWDEALRRNRELLGSGHIHTAVNLLAAVLTDLDPITAPADPQLVELVQRYLAQGDIVAYLDHAGSRSTDDQFRLNWSLYAVAKCEQLHGRQTPAWQKAADLHARVLARQGLTGDAATIQHRRLEAILTAGDTVSIAKASEDLAYALHADGQCDAAHDTIATALDRWTATVLLCLDAVSDQVCRYGVDLAKTAVLLLVGCHQFERARDLIGQYAHLLGEAGSTVRADTIYSGLTPLGGHDQCRHPLVCKLHPEPRFVHDEELTQFRIERAVNRLTGRADHEIGAFS